MARVKRNPEDPKPREVLADAIIKISEAATALRRDGLNEDAIVVLLHDRTKLSKRDIRTTLRGLRELREAYCVPEDDLMVLSINDLEILSRSKNVLHNGGVRTLGDLTAMTEAQVLHLRNCGRQTLRDIQNGLDLYGLELAE